MGLFSRKRPKSAAVPEYAPDNVMFSTLANGAPASIVLDLGVHDIAPVAALPYFFALHVPYEVVHENGLPTEQQLERLHATEAAIRDIAAETFPHIVVGSVMAAGSRSIALYAPSQDSVTTFTDALIAQLDREVVSAFGYAEYDDPKWETYFDDLYPSPEQLADIRERG